MVTVSCFMAIQLDSERILPGYWGETITLGNLYPAQSNNSSLIVSVHVQQAAEHGPTSSQRNANSDRVI